MTVNDSKVCVWDETTILGITNPTHPEPQPNPIPNPKSSLNPNHNPTPCITPKHPETYQNSNLISNLKHNTFLTHPNPIFNLNPNPNFNSNMQPWEWRTLDVVDTNHIWV